jgi:hypothetical protein
MTPQEVAALCRDRPLFTREIHIPNAFYGHSHVLRRYAGFSRARSLKVAIEHGVIFHDYMWDVDLATRMPMFLCASTTRARMFETRSSGKRATAIGAMINYAAALVPDRAASERTLLAFPAHSTHHIEAAFDGEQFADALAQEGKRYGRVVVCMYWKDYLAGRAAPYERRGFTITTAGHMYDDKFLLRLVTIIRDSSLVITNEIGSCLLYAVLLGRPVWVRRQPIDYQSEAAIIERDSGNEFVDHPNVRRGVELFADRRDDISAAQRDYVYTLTGHDSVRSPHDMHDLLAEAEAAYRRTAGLADRAKDALARGMHNARSLTERHKR